LSLFRFDPWVEVIEDRGIDPTCTAFPAHGLDAAVERLAEQPVVPAYGLGRCCPFGLHLTAAGYRRATGRLYRGIPLKLEE
jgi:hypothetical protein